MILDALTSLPPVAALFIIALAVSFLVTVIYKFTTNQKVMKALQDEMKSLRTEIKQAKDPAQAASLNKRLMEKTFQQVTHSMKSTLITLIPIFLLIGWMNGHVAFSSLMPGEEFTASMQFKEGTVGSASISAPALQLLSEPVQSIGPGGKVSWTLKAPSQEGTNTLTYSFGDEVYTREVLVTNEWKYADPQLEKKRTFLGIINIGDDNPIKSDSPLVRVAVDLKPVRPLGNFMLFGWQPGWLATYFIFTLLLTYPIRRLLKVH